MDMKDRIDNFLKVAEERMNNDVQDKNLQRQLADLCGELSELIEDPDEQNRLHDGFVKAQANTRITAWDERFLDVIFGESKASAQTELYNAMVRDMSQGQLSRQGYGAGSLLSTGGAGATTSTTLTMGNTTISELELSAIKKLANENKI